MSTESTVVFGTQAGRVVAVKAGIVEWEHTVPGNEEVVSALTADEGWVYAQSSTRMTAFRTDGNGGPGTLAWSHSTGGSVPGPAVVSGNLVYFLRSSSELVGLDKKTGEPKKQLAVDDAANYTLAVDPTLGAEGTAWFANGKALYRADLASGYVAPIHGLTESESATAPVVCPDPHDTNDRLVWLPVVGKLPNQPPWYYSALLELKANGSELHRWPTDGQSYVTQNLATHGTYVVLTAHNIEFVNLTDRKAATAPAIPQLGNWATAQSPVQDGDGAAGHVYLPGIIALAAMTRGGPLPQGPEPTLLWVSEAGGPMQTPVLDPVRDDIFCANTYALYGIDAANGKTKWRVAALDVVSGTPVMLHAGSAASR